MRRKMAPSVMPTLVHASKHNAKIPQMFVGETNEGAKTKGQEGAWYQVPRSWGASINGWGHIWRLDGQWWKSITFATTIADTRRSIG